jgi:formylglycine-generating enzyme required for sulfatase activity/serine/threonine protein kinase
MPVQILCPNPECGASYSVDDENLGRLDRCERCGTKFPLVPPTRGDDPPSQSPETDLEEAPSPAEPELPSPFGHYQILRTLGRGGMGAVYLALDTKLERRVALKVPHRAFAQDPGMRERFLREARAAARFHHPNFCPIHEIGEINGLPYLTMAYIEGGTLASQLERGQPWDQRRAAEVVRVLAMALAKAHREGIVHRDLKPSNIMVDDQGGLVIMDFGLARRFEAADPSLTAAGAVLGTPGYMPPEQAEGHSAKVGPRSDVYSLGVILYELISGRRPFEGSVARVLAMILTAEPATPSTHHPEVHPVLESICLRAMAREVEDRYPSMDEFAGALDGFLKAPSEPSPVVPPEPEPSGVGIAHRCPDAAPRSVGGAHPAKGSPPGPSEAEGSPPGRSWIVVVASTFVAALVVLGVIIYVATDKGQIRIDIKDADAVVKIDNGQEVRIEGLGEPITLRTGDHELSVKRGDGEFETRKFTIRRGDNPALSVEFKPKKSAPASIVEAPATNAAPPPPIPEKTAVKPDDTLITNTIGIKLRRIPAGTFFLGSRDGDAQAYGDEKPGHDVRLGAFYLGETEVTQGQYRAVTGESPSHFKGSDDLPVEQVSWLDAVRFCNALSQREGLSPYYRIEGDAVSVPDWKGSGYRLPTEAEWEYACRAGPGGVGAFCFGDDAGQLGRYAWYDSNSDGNTHPVGQKLANAFGLFDMHGNVWEWCWDGYADYDANPAVDPVGPLWAAFRVIRGGGWSRDPRFCRSADRSRYAPVIRSIILGFRVARVRSGP